MRNMGAFGLTIMGVQVNTPATFMCISPRPITLTEACMLKHLVLASRGRSKYSYRHVASFEASQGEIRSRRCEFGVGN